MSAVLDLVLVGTAWCHVFLAPYTKVEESFNLHATHDVFMYGIRWNALHNYDHFVFPGAVPRTFIGSVLLAWISTTAINVACGLGFLYSKFDLQIIVRLVLATVNAVSLCMLRRAVSHRFGSSTSALFVILSCTQFHLPFWMGRTLPNMFALFPANVALYLLMNRAPNSKRPSQSAVHRAIALLTFTAAVFRSELSLLLGTLVLQALICRYSTFAGLFKVGLISGICSAALTMVVDSYFWQRWPLWPEFYGIYFNVLEGKSSEWGVSPFHSYFTAHLPKLLLSSLPLSLIGFLSDSRIRAHLLPTIAFLLLISGLDHKEWRFVVYVVPIFNIAAARGAAWMISRRKSSLFGRICLMTVIGLVACNCLATHLLTKASMANYPGGESLARFNELYDGYDHVHVYISNLAAQTGASLFLQTHAPPYPPGIDIVPTTPHWTYNKTEHLSPQALTADRKITHVIAESGPTLSRPTGFSTAAWKAVDTVDGFDWWVVNPELKNVIRGKLQNVMGIMDVLLHPLEMITSEKLVILQRSI
ncbi:glycosyltransferase family 22 protein [Laetiporus sulphureus 93-53]|uniref:Mannosyltransferase n=1 Tax=Laetiporus sulphureus 93-53 TaxID=1314785 RepID=A0A165BS28_9APHY|nr:glycosyltransferase family 22 protein [Laetiporus sulphureus 93-53]KZT01550.1 glycosyltransferase family 22 protein [Laetiporus sulphureus 93-53]